MNPAAKLAGFVVALALVFGGASAAGRALDPFGDEPVETDHGHSPTTTSWPHDGEHKTTTTAAGEHQDHEEGAP